MPDFGHPVNIMGAFLFSKNRPHAADQTIQFAACTVVSMSSGLFFLDNVTLLHWEYFFPGLAVRWYELLTRNKPIDVESLRQYTRQKNPRTKRLTGVGYPKTLTPYYEKIKPRWQSLDVSMEDLQLLTMGFHAAREYRDTLNRAPLQFAHYAAQHDMVYANPLLKAAISLALMMHKVYKSALIYDVESTTLSVDSPGDRHHHDVALSTYVLVA
jgi:hypothetical protein